MSAAQRSELPPEEYVVFDLETTGLSCTADRIIEIAAARFCKGKCTGTFETLVNPRRPIPWCASRVNGIADGMVAAAPYIEAVMPRFLEFVGALPLVAHNAAFDMGFIRPYLSEAPRVYDTLRLSRAAFPGLRSYNLEKLCLALSIEAEGFHRALADVEVTAELFLLCCKALSDEAVRV